MKNNILGIIVCVIIIIATSVFIAQKVSGVSFGGDINMVDSHKIINLVGGSNSDDAATFGQITSGTSVWQEGVGYIYYDGGDVGIGTGMPDAKLNIGETIGATILLVREDSVGTVTDELLGRILFDSTDGGICSVDAPAVIEAYATELFSSSDKGGKLLFKVKNIDADSGAAAVTKMEINQDGVRMILENRQTNPAGAGVGQMWICTDAGGDCQ